MYFGGCICVLAETARRSYLVHIGNTWAQGWTWYCWNRIGNPEWLRHQRSTGRPMSRCLMLEECLQRSAGLSMECSNWNSKDNLDIRCTSTGTWLSLWYQLYLYPFHIYVCSSRIQFCPPSFCTFELSGGFHRVGCLWDVRSLEDECSLPPSLGSHTLVLDMFPLLNLLHQWRKTGTLDRKSNIIWCQRWRKSWSTKLAFGTGYGKCQP